MVDLDTACHIDLAIADLQQCMFYHSEHDIDCEEGGPNDRCPPCLVTNALQHLSNIER
jgi:hypothetical protein